MNLTEMAYYTRKGIVILAIGLFVVLIGRGILLFAIEQYREAHRPPPPPPSVRFDKLPPFGLPETGKNYDLSFELVTKEVGLPATPDRLEVFLIPKKLPSLLASDRAKAFAAQLKFTAPPEQKSPSEFFFTDSTNPARSLLFNSATTNFHLRYDLAIDHSAATTSSTLLETTATTDARNFLSSIGELLPDFVQEKTTLQLLSLEGENFIPSRDETTAIAARVNFFLKDINNLPRVTATYSASPSYIIVGKSEDVSKKILEARVAYFPSDEMVNSTYPLKTSAQAWEELTTGKGYIAQPASSGAKKIFVRKVYLAYFDANDYQQYLQPVFVFEGDDNFVGYVPAITADWVLPRAN